MKKQNVFTTALLLVLFLTVSLTSSAQELMLKDATMEGFKGVKKMGNDGYYVQFIESIKLLKKEKTIRVALINNNLEAISEFIITLMPSEDIEDVGYNGGNFMIATKHKSKRYRVFRIMDKGGNELAKKTFEDVKARFLKKDISVIPVDASDFLVLNYVKEDQIGYSLERYNNKLDLLYTESNIPDKKMLYPVDYEVAGNILYVMENMTQGTDYFQYSISGFDIVSGKKLFTKSLDDAEAKVNGLATFLRVSEKGDAITGGMYFNGNRIQEANSDGFFGALVDREGNLRMGHKDWKDVKDQIDNAGLGAMWGGKTKTLLQDVVTYEDGTFSIIGENFRRGDADLAGDGNKLMGSVTKIGKMASTEDEIKEEAVTVSDFIIFDFDVTSKFQGIRYVEKPPVVTIIKPTADENDKPTADDWKGMELANVLNNHGYFPYRFTVGKAGKKYMTYYYNYQYDGSEYMYFSDIKSGEQNGERIDISSYRVKTALEFRDAFIQSMPKWLQKAALADFENYDNGFELRGSYDGNDNRARLVNTRIFPSNLDGKVVIYDFVPSEEDMADSEKKKNWISTFSTASNGNFKIWYIDVP